MLAPELNYRRLVREGSLKWDTNLGQVMLLGTPSLSRLARSRGDVHSLFLSAKRTVTRAAALQTSVKVVCGSRRNTHGSTQGNRHSRKCVGSDGRRTRDTVVYGGMEAGRCVCTLLRGAVVRRSVVVPQFFRLSE